MCKMNIIYPLHFIYSILYILIYTFRKQSLFKENNMEVKKMNVILITIL